MATNGIVSIVDKEGRTLIKVVAGCDGYNAEKLAKALRKSPTLEPNTIRDMAVAAGFGCNDCLVVQDPAGDLFPELSDLGPLYREKFSDPRFNPRWESGIAPRVEIVEVDW